MFSTSATFFRLQIFTQPFLTRGYFFFQSHGKSPNRRRETWRNGKIIQHSRIFFFFLSRNYLKINQQIRRLAFWFFFSPILRLKLLFFSCLYFNYNLKKFLNLTHMNVFFCFINFCADNGERIFLFFAIIPPVANGQRDACKIYLS